MKITAEAMSMLARCLRDRSVEVWGSGMPGVAGPLPARLMRWRCEWARISLMALSGFAS